MEGREIMNLIDELVEKRRKGELGAKDFYVSLLDVLSRLATALKEEEISDADITFQIPLILAFLYEQAERLEKLQ